MLRRLGFRPVFKTTSVLTQARPIVKSSLLSTQNFTYTRAMSSTAASKVQEIPNLTEFRKFVESGDKISVIDFYATWCGPCKALEPIFELLAERVPEVQFGRVDVDQAQDVAQEYAVTAMPTCIFFKNGEKVDTIVGANPPKLVALIQQHSGVDVSAR
ncbi:thioredoxin-like protein [Scheffersomyces xylosifermentans]|uniref:thioredoxin-like protein n=1 Tax=Scheffersomyces xylosifermentans TaxID=1304137 RepID=UPI00315DF44A